MHSSIPLARRSRPVKDQRLIEDENIYRGGAEDAEESG